MGQRFTQEQKDEYGSFLNYTEENGKIYYNAIDPTEGRSLTSWCCQIVADDEWD